MMLKSQKLKLKSQKEPKTAIKTRSLLDQVEYCDRNGQYELDISQLNLSTWPQETVLVSSIRVLNAEKNSLDILPALDHFRALTELKLSRNNLSDVHNVRFGAIVALRKIDLSRNKLTSLPQDITRLTLLETLIIRQNNIQFLPDGMGALKALQELDAAYNDLQDVGDALEGIATLESVNFMNNDNLDIENLGARTRRLHEKRLLTSSKTARRALVQRALGIQRRVQNQEQMLIITAMQESAASLSKEINPYP